VIVLVYQILFSQRAKKDLLGFPQELRIRIELALKELAENADQRHDVVKIKDSPRKNPRYRLRIGEYRATFFIHHDILIIEIITIGKKKNFDYTG
jgi:mRNA-degrading endonuclease RelE of RelBE toxin-antitoxin system